jgi:U3 small nucleolar RNA-associated protein 19
MFAAVLDKDLSDRKKTAEVDMAPLRGGSYASMLTGELSRRLKRVPTAFYAERPARLLAPEACARDFVGWSLD